MERKQMLKPFPAFMLHSNVTQGGLELTFYGNVESATVLCGLPATTGSQRVGPMTSLSLFFRVSS